MTLSRRNPIPWLVFIKAFSTLALLFGAIWGFVYFVFLPLPITRNAEAENLSVMNMIAGWEKLSGGKKARVVFARPPHMWVLDLKTGESHKIPGITVEGGSGRKMRGLTPRPFWSPDGNRFIYRTAGRIFVSDLDGRRKPIINPSMDSGKESRWSWWQDRDGVDWAVGPSITGNILLVNIGHPSKVKEVYSGGDVIDWCEMTGNGKHLVFDTGSDIYVSPVGDASRRIKISHGQSCRPCAAPDNRVAWLPAPHLQYYIFNAVSGKLIGELKAPEHEQIYRLNWSNRPDFAVHMFGSESNQRMNVRRVSSGEHVFIGYGWDPDLWVE